MNTRQQKKKTLREGLDGLQAQTRRRDDQSRIDLDRLSLSERDAFEKLIELLEGDGVRDFSRLDDMQLIYLRALHRKAIDQINLDSPISADDRRDCRYLEKINLENFDVENISPYG